jgi:hypothetical protein
MVGKGKWISNLPNIIKYIKIRYQEWLFAGGEDSGEKFFIDLWDPKALKAFSDPDKDTHPGAQLLRDWNKGQGEHKQEKESVNKYYKPTRHISWIEIIPKYIFPREAAALSTEEKEKLLKPFERPRFPLPDLTVEEVE